ncbi:MAG: prepilin-type N-terminal cleavage/methylation domain-containing protein [Myxococcales bacterium]|nr:prepilin-type N-terminal cleavage/methylation domain-containing protein [Myxococcales bacterium]
MARPSNMSSCTASDLRSPVPARTSWARSDVSQSRRERGFTVIELMVAMAVGLIVAMAAFTLARNASQLFLQEARISSTRLGAILGLTRLQEDLRRASMQSSPNAKFDQDVCAFSLSWPQGTPKSPGAGNLAGIYIQQNGSSDRNPGELTTSLNAGLKPDSITISGMLSSSEHYAAAAVEPVAGGYEIFLELNGAYWRSKLAGIDLGRVFTKGRLLRLTDAEGKAGYGEISNFDGMGAKPKITVSGTKLVLPKREKNVICGCEGHCTGSLVSPITRVIYDLREMPAAKYPKYAGIHSTAALGNAAKYYKGPPVPQRTELVREEIDVAGVPVPGTAELVAEFAVDLKFGITVAKPGGAPDYVPTVTRHAFGTAPVYVQAGLPAGTGHPEHISSVQVRLSTRAPFGDRRVGLAATSNGGLRRINIGGELPFARVSTLTTDVLLPNQAGIDW